MASGCYLCDTGHDKISDKNAGKVLGVCENCSILACEAHAQRDPNHPRWICVLCDTSLLTAAGITTSNGSSLNSVLTVLISSAILKDGSRYKTLEQFLEDRPNYSWILNQIDEVLVLARKRFTTDITEPFWFGLSEQGQKLIAAAIIIAERFELSEYDLVETLRILLHDWRSRE